MKRGIVPRLGPDDIAAISYAFGRRGKPRGIELTHRNLLHVASQFAEAAALGPGDAVAGVSTWHQVFGLGPILLGTALGGASVILNSSVGGKGTLKRAGRQHASVLCGVPAFFAAALRALGRGASAPNSLRLCVTFGAPLRDDLAARVEAALGVPLLIAYSLPEAAGVVAMSRPGDPPWQAHLHGRAPPIAETVVKVTDGGNALPPESVGDLWIRGPGVTRGYHRQPRETAAGVDEAGFLRTGDLGMVDEDGYVHLLGRRDEVVIRAGITVHPHEVEERLRSHPAVAEAAVVGASDEVLGEAICACVVRVEGGVVTEPEVVAWCRSALAPYKVPDTVSFMDELPLSASGKVWRQELRRHAATVRAKPLA